MAIQAQLPCTDEDPEMWFSSDVDDLAAAQQICQSCPSRERCFQTAVVNGERHGMWGGMSEETLRVHTKGVRRSKVVTAVVAA